MSQNSSVHSALIDKINGLACQIVQTIQIYRLLTETFVVPDDVGGRFSVLTAVGLLPIAVSGADIDKLMEGAASGRKRALENDFEETLSFP